MADPGPPPRPGDTRAIYQANARTFDRLRTKTLFEAGWLARFAAVLPSGGRVLDLGCGTGDPVSGWLIDRGLTVTGVDFAAAMLSRARARWPGGDWRLDDMRSLDLSQCFDGVLSWNGFFHLTPKEQRACLPRLADHLRPGGVLLLTVGPEAGESTGQVGEMAVYHASLSAAEYSARLSTCGLRLTDIVTEDPGCRGHSVLMARKLG